MTQGFDEFYKKYHNLNGYEHHYEEFYEAGAASRQAEIDELQKRINFLEKGLSTVIRESGFIGYREIRGLCRSLLKGESNE